MRFPSESGIFPTNSFALRPRCVSWVKFPKKDGISLGKNRLAPRFKCSSKAKCLKE